jgi:cell division protein FtsB
MNYLLYLILSLLLLALIWVQAHHLRRNAYHIAHLERLVEGQRSRIDILEAAVAIEREYATLLQDEVTHTERRAAHMEHCVRTVLEGTPKATRQSALASYHDMSMN